MPIYKHDRGIELESTEKKTCHREIDFFRVFLGVKDLMAWTDMETFRRVPRPMEEKRDKKAKEIRDSWLGKKYFFGPDSPATREGRNLVSFSRMKG